MEYIDQRKVWGIPCCENFYSNNIHSYELSLHKLRRFVTQQGLEQVHSYNIGTSISQQDFEAGRFIAGQIFLFVGRTLPAAAQPRTIDSGMYACIYLDNYNQEIPCATRLLEYCRTNGYRIAGDYICEVMSGFPVFDSDPNRMFLRLQVPVSFSK